MTIFSKSLLKILQNKNRITFTLEIQINNNNNNKDQLGLID